jgi:hypothetical protein
VNRITLFPFSYFDLRTRRWVRARYRARLEEIAVRYPAFRIAGPPEIREGDGTGNTAGHLARGPGRR